MQIEGLVFPPDSFSSHQILLIPLLLLVRNTAQTLVDRLGHLIQAAGSGRKEPQEGPAGRQDSAEIFGVELHTHEPGVVANLNNLHTLTLGVLANERQTGLLDALHHVGVNFIPVTVAL